MPALVTVHLWDVPTRHVPAAVARMALDRGPVRRHPGARFAKLLGTGDGRTFTVRDADPNRWALLVAWADVDDAAAFERSATVRRWARLSRAALRVDLRPLAARGRWSGRAPFGEPRPVRWAGEVAALTRARISPRRAGAFWRAVPAVSADLHAGTGLRFAVGVGEAPVGLQGTFSVWESAEALTDFAHRRGPHADAVRRTSEERWYREELFARFAVVGTSGALDGYPA